MSTYPGTIDSYNVIGTTNYMDESGYVLHERLNSHGSAVTNIETVMGTTAGTSVLKDFTAGEFAVARNAGGTLRDTITLGTINNAVFGSPTVTGGTFSGGVTTTGTVNAVAGTINNGVFGTPAINGGTYTSPTLSGTPVLDSTSAIPFYGDNMSRQAIINGNFDVWQRGTTGTPGTLDSLYADRWKVQQSADGGTLPTVIHSRQTLDVGDIPNSYYFYRINTNGAGSGFGTASYGWIHERIEWGTRMLCGNGKSVTVSLWAKSDISNKKLGIGVVQQYGTGGTPTSLEELGGTAVSLGTAWSKYTITVSTNTLSGKTFGTGNDDWLGLYFGYQWGSTYNSRFSAGTAETYVGSGDIDIAQVQLCAGDVALPFQPKSYDQELDACQRYFQLYGGDGSYSNYGNGMFISGTVSINYIPFYKKMRTIPTSVTTSGTAANYQLFVYPTVGGIALSAAPTSAANWTQHSAWLYANVASGGTAGQMTMLRNNNTTAGFIGFSAEL